MKIVHSLRELIKITQMKDGAVYSTKSLGLWYVPLGSDGDNPGHPKKEMAKELGGDEWGSPSTWWCIKHNDEIFRGFTVAGYYKLEEE